MLSMLYRLTLRLPFTAHTLSLLPAAEGQRGFWFDRPSDCCAVFGLGRALLYVERASAAPLLRYCV